MSCASDPSSPLLFSPAIHRLGGWPRVLHCIPPAGIDSAIAIVIAVARWD